MKIIKKVKVVIKMYHGKKYKINNNELINDININT